MCIVIKTHFGHDEPPPFPLFPFFKKNKILEMFWQNKRACGGLFKRHRGNDINQQRASITEIYQKKLERHDARGR